MRERELMEDVVAALVSVLLAITAYFAIGDGREFKQPDYRKLVIESKEYGRVMIRSESG